WAEPDAERRCTVGTAERRFATTSGDSAESSESNRSAVCLPRASGQQLTRLFRRRAAQPGFCQPGFHPRSRRAHAGELDLPRPVLQPTMAAPLRLPDRDRLDRPAVLAIRLRRFRRLYLLPVRV